MTGEHPAEQRFFLKKPEGAEVHEDASEMVEMLRLAKDEAGKIRVPLRRVRALAKVIRFAQEHGVDVEPAKEELNRIIEAIEDPDKQEKLDAIFTSLERSSPKKEDASSSPEAPKITKNDFTSRCDSITKENSRGYRVNLALPLLEEAASAGIDVDDLFTTTREDVRTVHGSMDRLGYLLRLAKVGRTLGKETREFYEEAYGISLKQKPDMRIQAYLELIPAYVSAGLDYQTLLTEIAPVLDRKRKNDPYHTACDELMIAQHLRAAGPEIVRPFLDRAMTYAQTIGGPNDQSDFIDRMTDAMLKIADAKIPR